MRFPVGKRWIFERRQAGFVENVNASVHHKPGQQGLVTDPVKRGEARATQPTGLVGFEQPLLLLRSVTRTPEPVPQNGARV